MSSLSQIATPNGQETTLNGKQNFTAKGTFLFKVSKHLKGRFKGTFPWVGGWITRFSAKASKPVYIVTP